jgi:hypothetical protein
MTMPEIAFDEEHISATVFYNFDSGGLCGPQKTLELAKVGEVWRITGICAKGMY